MFFLKYKGEGGQIDPSPEKTSFKKPSLIRVKLNYYPLMISLYKCNGSCKAVDELFTKICIPIKTKDVKVFKLILRGIEQEYMKPKHL